MEIQESESESERESACTLIIPSFAKASFKQIRADAISWAIKFRNFVRKCVKRKFIQCQTRAEMNKAIIARITLRNAWLLEQERYCAGDFFARS